MASTCLSSKQPSLCLKFVIRLAFLPPESSVDKRVTAMINPAKVSFIIYTGAQADTTTAHNVKLILISKAVLAHMGCLPVNTFLRVRV